ncbi:MAG: 2-C-methyl-D-erythritol 2,4-cyclodiphosphate synthase [Candidatus Omnitrophota bacterium]|nr:2-C-methyl-D-erythritol 2,4-cyclodiphosphate synthase [Candidatus Omnitrophota bacterium]
MIRIGIGYDIHRLVKGRKLILGGVAIPYSKGLSGHSDADALIHAICDALLGAAALGDIGEHFPDTDKRYEGISSVKLLTRVLALLKKRKLSINNIDCIIIAQEPKLILYKNQIRSNISRLLGIKESCLNVKAKTNEGLGELGKQKAIAVYAACLVEA